MRATAAFRISDVLELAAAAAGEWDKIAAIIVPTGEGPNWHTRPSILDQLCGWRAAPAAKKKLSPRMHAWEDTA
jgi:hypothetical protein